ncbi:MAG: glycosyltransferase family 1 protein [Micromonosporaceae bacterium]
MTKVLILANTLPVDTSVLRDALRKFGDKAATVSLACFVPPEEPALDASLAEVRSFALTEEQLTPLRRAAIERARPSRRVWLHAKRHRWLRERAREADLLVALDPIAVHTAWELAQRCPKADAVYGLAPALRQLDKRTTEGGPSGLTVLRRRISGPLLVWPRAVRRFAIWLAVAVSVRATGRRMMRTAPGIWFWTAIVGMPGLPDRIRMRLVRQVSRGMLEAERADAARRATVAAMQRISDPVQRADLLANEAVAHLTQGMTPESLKDAVAAQLALADAQLAKDPAKAAHGVSRASTLISHRVLHFDRFSSPLVDDPDGFLADYRNSAAIQKLAAPRGRARPAAAPPTGRPLRLLFVTLINDNFLHEIRQRYEDLPGVEVRFVDLYADPSRHRLVRAGESMMQHVLAGGSPYGQEVDQWLRPYLDWADTVFIDWCQAQAALFTLIDPGTTRIVLRLHSFEAFNFWPHLVDFSRIDDMVFVSEHLKEFTVKIHPRLVGEHAPRLHALTNAMDLRKYQHGEKPAEARFTLGMVGVGQVAKDPRWAIEVLKLVREQDERYRMVLIGEMLKPGVSMAAREYYEALMAEVDELEAADALVQVGKTDDVPTALEQVGVILSTSLRESFHCGLVEGAASGAVPVVRDWPYFAGLPHSARTLFPAEWVAGTPEEAAKRILATTSSEESWRDEGAAAAEHVVTNWDWTVTRRGFDELLLGAPVDE